MEVRWVVSTEGEVALATAGTAKSILSAIAPTGKHVRVCEIYVVPDATPTEPILVEAMACTMATTGTSTSVTPRKESGEAVNATAALTGGKNYTAEPTVLSVIRDWTIADKGGAPFPIQLPLGRELVSGDGDGIVLRLTNPTGTSPNVRAHMVCKVDG